MIHTSARHHGIDHLFFNAYANRQKCHDLYDTYHHAENGEKCPDFSSLHIHKAQMPYPPHILLLLVYSPHLLSYCRTTHQNSNIKFSLTITVFGVIFYLFHIIIYRGFHHYIKFTCKLRLVSLFVFIRHHHCGYLAR